MIRAAGCALSCAYCDTEFSRSRQGAERLPVDEIVRRAVGFGARHVELTGGEPLEQPASHQVLRRLCDRDRVVLLETSGARSVAAVDPRVNIVMDIKCPGSGMAHRFDAANIKHLKPTDQVKFVLSDRDDYRFARRTMERLDLPRRCAVLLSPAEGRVEPAELAAWMLADRLEARLQLQLHRWLWPNETRGV